MTTKQNNNERASFGITTSVYNPPKVTNLADVLEELYLIGRLKNELPSQVRGWVNVAGLYVQLRTSGLKARLEAGGQLHCCIDAKTDNYLDSDADSWNITCFEKAIWNKAFAQLVYPTHEIVLFLSGNPWEPSIDLSDGQHFYRIQEEVRKLKQTGEWKGLFTINCKTCHTNLRIWQFAGNQYCPFCHGQMGTIWDSSPTSNTQSHLKK